MMQEVSQQPRQRHAHIQTFPGFMELDALLRKAPGMIVSIAFCSPRFIVQRLPAGPTKTLAGNSYVSLCFHGSSLSRQAVVVWAKAQIQSRGFWKHCPSGETQARITAQIVWIRCVNHNVAIKALTNLFAPGFTGKAVPLWITINSMILENLCCFNLFHLTLLKKNREPLTDWPGLMDSNHRFTSPLDNVFLRHLRQLAERYIPKKNSAFLRNFRSFKLSSLIHQNLCSTKFRAIIIKITIAKITLAILTFWVCR
jgi:hypothetical protein